MQESTNLNMPFIAQAQANKHITHNDAILRLDAIVQLSVVDRNLVAPPVSPVEGDRYIVAASATGLWTGKSGEIAAFQNGDWVFYPPNEGWRAWVADEDLLMVWNGTTWGAFGGGGSTNPTPLLGVNTTANSLNKLSVKSDAVLFSHDDVTPGSGDVQAKLNKASQTDTASFIFQNNWSGRAEFGLVDDDDFSLKTSADGTVFKQSLVASADNASVQFPNGVSDLGIGSIGGIRNVIVNGTGGVNQRGFVGGALLAGAYGFDRWRAATGGCTVSNTGGLWSLVGPLEQVVENPGLANKTVTVSVEDPSTDIAVTIGSQSGTLLSGSGKQSLSMTLGVGDSGDLVVKLNPAATSTFKNIQLEEGPVATPFERRPSSLELILCQRYYLSFRPNLGGGMALAMAQTTNQYVVVLPVPVNLRIIPSIAHSGAFRIYRYDGVVSSVSNIVFRSLDANILRLTVTTATYPGPSLAIFYPFGGSVLEFDAEL